MEAMCVAGGEVMVCSSPLQPTHKHKHARHHPCRLSAFRGLQGVCCIGLSAVVSVIVPASRRIKRGQPEKVQRWKKKHLVFKESLIY